MNIKTITVQRYYRDLAIGKTYTLLNSTTKSCGALYNENGTQLFYSDEIQVVENV